METLRIFLEAAVVIAAIVLGVRTGGVGIGLWGGVGTAILVFVCREPLGSPPIDSFLIIIAVILAAATLQASGGIAWMVLVAARVIVRRPRLITYVAPLVSLVFSIGAGTSNILFSLLPVIQEVSVRARIRPSKPIAVSVVATSVALACSPVSAAMAAMIAVLDKQTSTGGNVLQLMALTVPAAVVGILATSAVVSRFGGSNHWSSAKGCGRPSTDGTRATAGSAPSTTAPSATASGTTAPASETVPGSGTLPVSEIAPASDTLRALAEQVTGRGRLSGLVYLVGLATIITFGLFPHLRPHNGAGEMASLGTIIQLVMLVVSTIMVIISRPDMPSIPRTGIFQGGIVAAIAFFGLAWMIDTFVAAHITVAQHGLAAAVARWPLVMALAIFVIAALTTSQSAATRLMIPIGLSAGLPVGLVSGLWVGALGGIYLLPTNGLQIAAATLDTTGSTKLGRRLYDHSFFVPSILVTVFTIAAGVLLSMLFGW